MPISRIIIPIVAAFLLAACSLIPKETEAQTTPPPLSPAAAPAVNPNDATDWIDPDTGHRIVRLSTEPGTLALYFHQNAFTPQGDALILNAPSGIVAIDLKTRSDQNRCSRKGQRAFCRPQETQRLLHETRRARARRRRRSGRYLRGRYRYGSNTHGRSRSAR